MSKYALKLEQLVQTDQYGEILVTIQYDGQGPKLVSASGDGLDPELKHALDTILGLVNFTLAKQIAPSEIADQLETEPEDGIHLPINDILLVIASSLREAPEGIDKFTPDILMDIMPEMIQDFTRNASESMFNIDSANQDMDNSQNQAQKQEEEYDQNQNTSEQNNQNQDEDNDKRSSFFGGFNRN
jgi:hypothetical protein